jgi:hypothetical protein
MVEPSIHHHPTNPFPDNRRVTWLDAMMMLTEKTTIVITPVKGIHPLRSE